MNRITAALLDVVRDERAAEALDYCLVVGLIVIAALSVMNMVGLRVLARWTSLDNAM